jgi:hypothetical protein
MFSAIGLTGQGIALTEAEFWGARLTDRPAAGARPAQARTRRRRVAHGGRGRRDQHHRGGLRRRRLGAHDRGAWHWPGNGGLTGRAVRLSCGSRRIGLGREDKFSRCALPTTAFFEIPIRRPISAVERPSAQKARSLSIASCVQSMKELPLLSPTQHTVGKRGQRHKFYEGPRQRNLWKTPDSALSAGFLGAPIGHDKSIFRCDSAACP